MGLNAVKVRSTLVKVDWRHSQWSWELIKARKVFRLTWKGSWRCRKMIQMESKKVELEQSWSAYNASVWSWSDAHKMDHNCQIMLGKGIGMYVKASINIWCCVGVVQELRCHSILVETVWKPSKCVWTFPKLIALVRGHVTKNAKSTWPFPELQLQGGPINAGNECKMGPKWHVFWAPVTFLSLSTNSMFSLSFFL
jgi:hypothetical protein